MGRELEKFTLHVDSFQQSANSFQVYINIPLKTVIKAEILSINLGSNVVTSSSNIAYVIIDELISRFNDKTLPAVVESIRNTGDSMSGAATNGSASTYQPYLTSNISNMQRSFMKINMEPIGGRTLFDIGNMYPTDTDYIQPIQQLDKLTITIYDENGIPITTSGPTFITLRFYCARDNMYKY
jgi:hypothetical protein